MHRAILPILLACLVASQAAAKSTSKMSEAELVEQLLTDTSSSKREQAADALGDRRMTGSIDALGNSCRPEEEPSVCEHALRALEELGTGAARAKVELALLNADLRDGPRKVAMRVLGRMDRARLAAIAPVVLTNFRSLDQGLSVGLLRAIEEGGNTAAGDLVLLIATDKGAARQTRIKALEVAEAFNHPRLVDAWVANLDDSDKKVRLRAAQSLGTAGLPGSLVIQPLAKVAQFDDKGDVRGAAFKSLRNYASPELVPLLNHAVVNERHIAAWGHAVMMFEVLADQTSLPSLQKMLRQGEYTDELAISLIHAAVRIGDPSSIGALQVLADRTEAELVRTEALAAIAILQGPIEQRIVYVAAWAPTVVIYAVTLEQEPVLPAMSVSLDASGSVQWSAGTDDVFLRAGFRADGTRIEAEVRVTE